MARFDKRRSVDTDELTSVDEKKAPCSEITIVIPTLDSTATLTALGKSILAQSQQPTEVVIVDSSTDPATANVAARMGFTVIREKTNRIAARLIGVRHATTSWVCMIDSDQLLSPDFVEQLTHSTHMKGVDAITALELSFGPSRWHQLLRTQDEVEFTKSEGLPRCFRRSVFLDFDWSRLPQIGMINGEDRLLRDWLIRTSRTIVSTRQAVLYHQDPEPGAYLLKQFRNTRTGTPSGIPSALAFGVLRSLVSLSDPIAVARVSRSPIRWFGYYWMLLNRVILQTSGMVVGRIAEL